MRRKLQKILLFPFALIYGLIIRIRNFLFDAGILREVSFEMPLIGVGNITVGGTGKTPLIEYLASMLKKDYNIAVLSRGYKRKTRDFNIVSTCSEIKTVGDEPLQIKQKHNDITVAVDRNRRKGVHEILARVPETDIILLDDAYQHRYIKAGLSILLTNYKRLITDDYLLPAGRLREHRASVKRADIVLVTKSPSVLPAASRQHIRNKLPLLPGQHLFFTSLSYDEPMLIFDGPGDEISMEMISREFKNVLLITGIAEPAPLVSFLKQYKPDITHLRFPDHHNYSYHDRKIIAKKYRSMPAGQRCLITTEKDALRLREKMSPDDFQDNRLFYLRINIIFPDEQSAAFNKLISDYVRENRRDNSLS